MCIYIYIYIHTHTHNFTAGKVYAVYQMLESRNVNVRRCLPSSVFDGTKWFGAEFYFCMQLFMELPGVLGGSYVVSPGLGGDFVMLHNLMPLNAHKVDCVFLPQGSKDSYF